MSRVRSELVFDQRYCHSAGQIDAAIYEIAKDTNELVFRFSSFDDFVRTYIDENRHLPKEVAQSLLSGRGHFCIQLVQDGAYVFIGELDGDLVTMSKQTLLPINGTPPLDTFTRGAIAIGIVVPAKEQFTVLWATMYETID